MEELKLIIEAVQGVSGDAKGLIIMYLIRGYIQMFLIAGILAFLISAAYRLFQKLIATCSLGEKVIAAARFKENYVCYNEKPEKIIKHLQNNIIDG